MTAGRLANEECERATLGGLMIEPSQLAEVAGIVQANDFTKDFYQSVFGAMLWLGEMGRPIDLLTVQAAMEEAGTLGDHYAQLVMLDSDLPSLDGLVYYARVVAECAARRRIQRIALRLAQAVEVSADPLDEILLRSLASLEQRESRQGAGWQSFSTVGRAALDALSAEREEGIAFPRLIPTLGKTVGVMSPGQMWIVGARPGVGKTSFILQVVEQAALDGRRVGVFSLEMRARDLFYRLVTARTQAPFASLLHRHLSAEKLREVQAVGEQIGRLSVEVEDCSCLSLAEIRFRARRLHAKEPIDLLAVDFLSLIASSGQHKRSDLEVSATATGLADLAKELGIPVLVAAQLNRSVSRERRRPMLSDLREGGGIEEAAHGILFLHREPRNALNPGLLGSQGAVLVAKNRGGETGEVPVRFEGVVMQFSETTTQQQGGSNVQKP